MRTLQTRKIVLHGVIIAASFLPHVLLACATCYGDPQDPMTHGANMGILTLLGVTAVVLGGFLALLVRLAIRSRRVLPNGYFID